MKVIGKGGQEITAWENWEAPRDKAKQWVEGRSAMEIARAFFRGGAAQVPSPLLAMLLREPSLAGFEAIEARPEVSPQTSPKTWRMTSCSRRMAS